LRPGGGTEEGGAFGLGGGTGRRVGGGLAGGGFALGLGWGTGGWGGALGSMRLLSAPFPPLFCVHCVQGYVAHKETPPPQD